MPGWLKALAYRHVRGYRVGRGVKFGLGSAVVGRDVEIGDGAEIGMLAVVIGRRIRMAAHSSVGMMSYVACNDIELGEDARIREQVYVGGPQLPESRFVLGARTIVLQMAYINPTKPVIIGDDSGIGGHCLIFTHGAWLSAFDGYPVTYAPVTIGASVWLPWRVFVMPGASIGDGSVIGANSLVSGDIPAGSLAVGSPAKVVRSAPDFPRRLDANGQRELLATVVAEFDRWVEDEGVVVQRVALDERIYQREGELHRLLVLGDSTGDALARAGAGDTVLALGPLDDSARDRLRRASVDYLDVTGKRRPRAGSALTEELAGFFGRYGVRFARD